MAQYFTKPARAWIEDEDAWDAPTLHHTPTVSDHVAIDTGLVDLNGDPIMRAPYPMGFGKDDEW